MDDGIDVQVTAMQELKTAINAKNTAETDSLTDKIVCYLIEQRYVVVIRLL